MNNNIDHRYRNAIIIILCVSVFNFSILSGQKQRTGTVSGVIIEQESKKPLEFANVIIRTLSDSTILLGSVTDKDGKFIIENVPPGKYKLLFSFIGYESKTSQPFTIDANHLKADLGTLFISNSTSSLNDVVVTGKRSTYVNSIDRKVFIVGEDLISKTGSVSDLMQNIPSVTVDIDGVISLRGSTSVMILINGKPSALMGANRAAVLQQMPASSIEKIEVITNPSAKYKPDGTSGIINIVLKKNKLLGFNGTATVNAGNEGRYNSSILTNYNPGKLNLSGSYNIRQDDRIRYTDDRRTRIDTVSKEKSYSSINAIDHSRPLSQIISLGADYKINDKNTIGINGSFNYRDFTRDQTNINKSRNSILEITKDYDRKNIGPQMEKDLEFGASMQHSFTKEGHELNLDFVTSSSVEKEDNHFRDIFRVPLISTTYDNTLIKQADKESQLTLEYKNPISETAKLEAGYIFESQKSDMDFSGEFLNNISNLWEKDIVKTNRFIYSTDIHVLYTTFEKELGRFGILGGLRAEEAFVTADQVTTDTIIKNQYFRLYPSLHLSFKLNEINELQLNYSHRIRRPEGDNANPFPEYQDPFNLRVGNPKLKPEEIHSVEMGYQFKEKHLTFLSTVYYRYTYNGMTSITRYMNDSVLLTTTENLSRNQSAGLELVFASTMGEIINVNLSTNAFYNTIDASSLGYSSKKSIFSWSSNLSAGINFSRTTVVQLTTNYIAKRLTPQGNMAPSYILNTGFKQEFLSNKAAFIFTMSDVLNTVRNTSIVNTPDLYQTVIRRRNARVFYFGLTYTFGNQNNKKNNSQLKYDIQQ